MEWMQFFEILGRLLRLSLTSAQLWDKQVHGILGEELAKGRAQRVVMNGASSGWQSVTSGFPQVSIPEPVQ